MGALATFQACCLGIREGGRRLFDVAAGGDVVAQAEGMEGYAGGDELGQDVGGGDGVDGIVPGVEAEEADPVATNKLGIQRKDMPEGKGG